MTETFTTTIDFHPIAAIFPMMSDAEMTSLTKDIKENGQSEPIWIFENQIIDGRNLYLACQKLGITPTGNEWQGEEKDLISFIRHLS